MAVVTSTTRLAALPANVGLPGHASGLPYDSVVNVTQVTTVDRAALEERIGELPDWLLAQVDGGLRRTLALGGS